LRKGTNHKRLTTKSPQIRMKRGGSLGRHMAGNSVGQTAHTAHNSEIQGGYERLGMWLSWGRQRMHTQFWWGNLCERPRRWEDKIKTDVWEVGCWRTWLSFMSSGGRWHQRISTFGFWYEGVVRQDGLRWQDAHTKSHETILGHTDRDTGVMPYVHLSWYQKESWVNYMHAEHWQTRWSLPLVPYIVSQLPCSWNPVKGEFMSTS
jgi:hypothetical protein